MCCLCSVWTFIGSTIEKMVQLSTLTYCLLRLAQDQSQPYNIERESSILQPTKPSSTKSVVNAMTSSKRAVPAPEWDLNLAWIDREPNQEQKQVVKKLVGLRYGSKAAPMLLFGAFGTGKTWYSLLSLFCSWFHKLTCCYLVTQKNSCWNSEADPQGPSLTRNQDIDSSPC